MNRNTVSYFEVKCVSCINIAEEVRNIKHPQLGRDMSGVWSNMDIELDVDDVEDAIKAVIDNNHIPITEEPETISVTEDDMIKPSKTVRSLNSPRTYVQASKKNIVEKDIQKTYQLISRKIHR